MGVFSLRQISLKVGDSHWSDKFSLDAVGSSGFIACKNDDKAREVNKKQLSLKLIHTPSCPSASQ